MGAKNIIVQTTIPCFVCFLKCFRWHFLKSGHISILNGVLTFLALFFFLFLQSSSSSPDGASHSKTKHTVEIYSQLINAVT